MRWVIFCFFMVVLLPMHAHAATQSYRPQITDNKTWYALAAQPTSVIFQQSDVVKFIIDFQEQNRIYFYNTTKYPFHIGFVHHYIAPDYDHAKFNKIEYHSPNRRFAMGSIVHYRDLDLYTLELSATDQMTSNMLAHTYRALNDKTFFDIVFRPQSPHQENISTKLPKDIAIVPISTFQHLQKYHALTLGQATGRLVFVDQDFDIATLQPDHIVIADHVPNDLPMIAGLITTRPQAPLSHVSILMSQRQKPNMMINHPEIVSKWRKMAGEYVTLDVSAQSYALTPTQAPANAAPNVKSVIDIAFDPDITALRPLCDIRKDDIGIYGGKSGYLGEVCQIFPKLSVPDGFAIPIHYYVQHIKTHEIDTLINNIDHKSPKDHLKIIKTAIKGRKVDTRLIEYVKTALKSQDFVHKKAFFRSSANIEDINGFSGAGLYQSKKLSNLQSDKEIAEVIKQIWASLWTYRAYQERQNFDINANHIAMGILVQPYVTGLSASGVAITGNPYTQYRPGYLVNVQIIGDTITDNKSNTMPESFIIYHYDKDLPIRIISRSDLNQHNQILDTAMRASLATYLKQIQEYFVPKPDKQNTQFMDVEFLVTQSGKIIIVQARPYQIQYRERKVRVP